MVNVSLADGLARPKRMFMMADEYCCPGKMLKRIASAYFLILVVRIGPGEIIQPTTVPGYLILLRYLNTD
jgi:hypothetical protein